VRNVSVSTDSDSTFRNLLNTYRRAEADPLAFARVQVDYEESSTILSADDEGFFNGWMDLAKSISGDKEWREYKVSLVEPVHPEIQTRAVKGEILIPLETARFGVISDIDDTVIQSRVSNFLAYSPLQYFRSPRDLMPHEL